MSPVNFKSALLVVLVVSHVSVQNSELEAIDVELREMLRYESFKKCSHFKQYS